MLVPAAALIMRDFTECRLEKVSIPRDSFVTRLKHTDLARQHQAKQRFVRMCESVPSRGTICGNCMLEYSQKRARSVWQHRMVRIGDICVKASPFSRCEPIGFSFTE